ncbi:hypothetical protein HF086_014104 [Spodoptera exigua]|uniref:rRNA adenine N(6)-methyltransferase n=1 Tax=Spodoptera exigua TaxID=7107 RepID=A0A922MMP2_SPOEX|nr:hypothetical protein HF086_014104 [Spodoptera exigua]
MLQRSRNCVSLITKGSNLKFHLRLSHKTSRQPKEKPPPKLATDVVNYINSTPEYNDIKNKIPNSLLRKYKTPESMYLINKKTAKDIVNTIKNNINNNSPLIEVNPGFGFLSEELLQCQKNPIYMFEMSSQFSSHLSKLQEQHPGRIKLKIADFFGMWKLAFKDKIDQGNRIEELLGELCTDDKNNEVQLKKHRSIPALFQMLFDHKVLTTVPKVHFLPWTHKPDSKKITMMDEHRLVLVNITQKDKLPCPPEQWIPGCGVWLITGQDPPDTNKQLAPSEDDAELPHMTIFTEFGDLNLQQKITVFKKFISWPEFEQCQFRVTMENNLPKFFTNIDDDDKEVIGTHIEDMEHSDAESET